MLHTQKIKEAIRFSIKTHEIHQKQKRTGKDIPYITHPLTVGLILASAGASEDTIVAGLLHDTIEDSIIEQKVTKEILAEKFGENVANLVDAVTEQDRKLAWDERKHIALEHIKHFSHDMLLVKSADLIANTSEIIADYEKDGNETFHRFSASKEKFLKVYVDAMKGVLYEWDANPLAEDIRYLSEAILAILTAEEKLSD